MQTSPAISKAIFAIVLLVVVAMVWGIVVYKKDPITTETPVVTQVADPTPTAKTEVDVDLNATPTATPTKTPLPTNTPTPPIEADPTPTLAPVEETIIIPTRVPEQRKITVTANEYSFAPQKITAFAGDTLTITIVNNGTQVHNFAIDELGVQTTTIDAESSIVATVTIPSNPETFYTFYSSIGTDRSLGMEGTISVTQ